jgi:hypothetical protein
MSKSPTWSEILLSSLSMIFIGCLLSHFDRSWSFIMEAILWRMWRHVITWPLSSLKCIGQRLGRFQKVIINKNGRPRGLFSIKTMFIVYLMTKSNKIEKFIFCVISPLNICADILIFCLLFHWNMILNSYFLLTLFIKN